MKKILFIIICCLCLCGCKVKKTEAIALKCTKVDTKITANTIAIIDEISINCENDIISNAEHSIVFSYYEYEDALNDMALLLQKGLYNNCSIKKGDSNIGILTCINSTNIDNINKCSEYKEYITSNGYACSNTLP